jgi:hypothetical protein
MADGLEARMDRVELNLERLVTVVSTMADQMVGFQNQLGTVIHVLTEVVEAQKRNEETVNILIRMMDEWIRKNPRN